MLNLNDARKRLLSVVTIVMVFLYASFPVQAMVSPDVVVKFTIDNLVENVKDNRNRYKTDSEALNQVVEHALEPTLHWKRLFNLVLGRTNSQTLSDERKDILEKEFKSYVIGNFSSALLKITDSNKAIYKPVTINQGSDKTIVNVELVEKNGTVFPIRFYMSNRKDDRWRAYNMKIGEVNIVSTYRSIMANLIAQRGWDKAASERKETTVATNNNLQKEYDRIQEELEEARDEERRAKRRAEREERIARNYRDSPTRRFTESVRRENEKLHGSNGSVTKQLRANKRYNEARDEARDLERQLEKARSALNSSRSSSSSARPSYDSGSSYDDSTAHRQNESNADSCSSYPPNPYYLGGGSTFQALCGQGDKRVNDLITRATEAGCFKPYGKTFSEMRSEWRNGCQDMRNAQQRHQRDAPSQNTGGDCRDWDLSSPCPYSKN